MPWCNVSFRLCVKRGIIAIALPFFLFDIIFFFFSLSYYTTYTSSILLSDICLSNNRDIPPTHSLTTHYHHYYSSQQLLPPNYSLRSTLDHLAESETGHQTNFQRPDPTRTSISQALTGLSQAVTVIDSAHHRHHKGKSQAIRRSDKKETTHHAHATQRSLFVLFSLSHLAQWITSSVSSRSCHSGL